MHKARYNSLHLDIEICPVGPLLIKSGGYSTNPSLPDMQFVRTYRAGIGESLYIPGSSMKGIVRGFVEKALRTIGDSNSWKWACPTFEKVGDSKQEPNCVQRVKGLADDDGKERKDLESWKVYHESCGACKLFGNTLLKGRLAFTDFLPSSEVKTETRYGVAISRLSHAVAQGPFELEVAVSGDFQGRVMLENYEIWQLGLLATSIEAMNQGFLKIGYGKNRGMGQVKASVKRAVVEEITPLRDDATIRGLGDFVGHAEREKYGLAEPFTLENAPLPINKENLGFYQVRSYDANGWKSLAEKAVQAL